MIRDDLKKRLFQTQSSRFVKTRKAEKEFRKFRIKLVEEFYSQKIDGMKLKEALGETEFQQVRKLMQAESSPSERDSRTSYDTILDFSSDSSIVEAHSCDSSFAEQDSIATSESPSLVDHRSDPKLHFKAPVISIENFFLEEASRDGFKDDRGDGHRSRLSLRKSKPPKLLITREMVENLSSDDILYKKRKPDYSVSDDLSKASAPKSVETSLFKVASEFCDWVEEVGLGKLTPEKVKEMFMLDDEDVVTDSMVVAPVEKLSLPKNIAKIVPDASSRAAVHRQIFWDSFYERKRKEMLKRGLLRASTKISDSLESWFRTSLLSKDLKNFNFFWQKLEEENLTDDFIVWLAKNPREYKPDFLSETGALERVENERKNSEELAARFNSKRKSSVIAAAALSPEEAGIVAKLDKIYGRLIKPEDLH